MDKEFLDDRDIPEKSDRLEEAKNTNTYPVYFSGDADVALVYVELYLWTWLIVEVEKLRKLGPLVDAMHESHKATIDSLTKELEELKLVIHQGNLDIQRWTNKAEKLEAKNAELKEKINDPS